MVPPSHPALDCRWSILAGQCDETRGRGVAERAVEPDSGSAPYPFSALRACPPQGTLSLTCGNVFKPTWSWGSRTRMGAFVSTLVRAHIAWSEHIS